MERLKVFAVHGVKVCAILQQGQDGEVVERCGELSSFCRFTAARTLKDAIAGVWKDMSSRHITWQEHMREWYVNGLQHEKPSSMEFGDCPVHKERWYAEEVSVPGHRIHAEPVSARAFQQADLLPGSVA